MRFQTEFLDYLKHTVANTIEYKDKGGDGHGEFIIEGTSFKKAKIVDSKLVYPKFTNSIKVSEKLKSKHKQQRFKNQSESRLELLKWSCTASKALLNILRFLSDLNLTAFLDQMARENLMFLILYVLFWEKSSFLVMLN